MDDDDRRSPNVRDRRVDRPYPDLPPRQWAAPRTFTRAASRASRRHLVRIDDLQLFRDVRLPSWPSRRTRPSYWSLEGPRAGASGTYQYVFKISEVVNPVLGNVCRVEHGKILEVCILVALGVTVKGGCLDLRVSSTYQTLSSVYLRAK